MTSKITLYDFLCILISGYLIILPFIFNEVCDINNSFPFFILAYLVGLVYHKIVELLYSPLRNCQYMIAKGKYRAIRSFVNHCKTSISNQDVDYYEAYYYLMRKNCLYVIPVLEAQVALIKTVFPILILYIIYLSANCSIIKMEDDLRIFIVITLGILIVTLPCVWYIIQVKVYRFVFEGYFFILNSIKKENEKNAV